MAKKMKKKGLAINNITFQDSPCPIKASGIPNIDYRDIELLKLFLTEKGKIMPRRITGVCSSNQKKLTLAIKRARNLALLSFAEGYISTESEEGNSTATHETREDVPAVSDAAVNEGELNEEEANEEEVSNESNS